MTTMTETTCRLLLLSLPLLFLILFNAAAPVAGEGFLDQINSDSVSELLSSGSLDDAKKAMSPDVQSAVQQLAASANAKSDDAEEALNSLAESPAEGPGPAAGSPASSEEDSSSWKDWLKEKMQGMGYGGPPSESPEAAPGPAWGPTASEELAPESSMEEAPAPAPVGTDTEAEGPTAEGPTAEGPTTEGPTAEGPTAEGPTAEGPTAAAPTPV